MFGKKKKTIETLDEEPVSKETTANDLLSAARDRTSVEDVLATIPEENRQKLLNQALLNAVETSTPAEGSIPALLNAGADVNAATLTKGVILAQAIGYDQPETVIREIYDNGARFEDALSVMKNNNWTLKFTYRLKSYQEAFESTPQAAENKEAAPQPVTEEAILKVLEIVQELREQMNDVTVRLDTLTKEVETVKAALPEASQKKPEPISLKSAAPRR